jgi:hypothetical protein
MPRNEKINCVSGNALSAYDCEVLGHHINEQVLRAAAAESQLIIGNPVQPKTRRQTEFSLCFRYANK